MTQYATGCFHRVFEELEFIKDHLKASAELRTVSNNSRSNVGILNKLPMKSPEELMEFAKAAEEREDGKKLVS